MVIVNLAHGFVEVFQPFDLLMLFVGLLVGMAVSIMPGLGLVMGVILALPFTYQMSIEPSVILLTAIYFSGTYGGCFTAILYRIPGRADGRADAVGRLHHGAARRAGQGAGLGARRRADCRPRLVGGHGRAGRSDERGGAQIRFARLFRRGVLRADHRRGARRKIDGQFADQPVRRALGGDDRYRQHLRHRPLYLRRADPARRRAASRGSGRHVRPRRGAGADRPGPASRPAERSQSQRRDAVSVAARIAGDQDDAVTQHRAGHRARHRAGRRRHHHLLHLLRHREAIRPAAAIAGQRHSRRHRRAADRRHRIGGGPHDPAVDLGPARQRRHRGHPRRVPAARRAAGPDVVRGSGVRR